MELLQNLLTAQKAFTDEAFGPLDPEIFCRKLLGEVKELLEEIETGKPSDDQMMIEFADVLLCLLSTFSAAFPDTNVRLLLAASFTKVFINRKRKWARQEDGTFQHI